MSDAYLRPNYNPTEGERVHRLAMEIGSAALLARLQAQHPAIVERLTRKQQEQTQ